MKSYLSTAADGTTENRLRSTAFSLFGSNGKTTFAAAVGNEVRAFQKSSTMELAQRIIILEREGATVEMSVFEECVRTIQGNFPNWNIVPVAKNSENSVCSVLNFMSNGMLLTVARASGMLKIPFVIRFFIPLLTTVMVACFVLWTQIVKSPDMTGASVGIVAGVSLCVFIPVGILFRKRYSDRYDDAFVKEQLRDTDNERQYHQVVASVARKVTDTMPVAVLVEDADALDALTRSVMEHIMCSGHVNAIGSILWVLFRKNGAATVNGFGLEIIPEKQFSLRYDNQAS